MKRVDIYDTTLRDGSQTEGISFSVEDKIRFTQRLDEMGIPYIEGGWPGSNPKDKEYFEKIQYIPLKNAIVTAFGSTRRANLVANKDENLRALLESKTKAITIFGKTWDLHIEEIMDNTLDENLHMIEDSIQHLKNHGKIVFYDAEHFFDGYQSNSKYAISTLQAAVKGGANALVLCDTNGGSLVSDISKITKEIKKLFPNVAIGIHTHNDMGLAVANSIVAVEMGATMIQGTMNGYGERCGNADLISLLPILHFKMKKETIPAENFSKLKSLSLFISETSNMPPLPNHPFIGRNAFTHKGGIHVNAIQKNPKAYEHMEPELIGNHRRVLVSDLAGKSNIHYKIQELGLLLNPDSFDTKDLVRQIKHLEQEGYQFDAADGSFKILVEKASRQFTPLFELESFRVTIEKNENAPCSSRASIKIRVGESTEMTAAEGDGPVSALDNALRKALAKFYPNLDEMHLVDFKVRVIDGLVGTAAKVRVLIESGDSENTWTTIGVSNDIIEASWQALADSFQYKLAKDQKK